MEEITTENTNEILTASQLFLKTLLDLPTETSDKDEINLNAVMEFCKEIDSVTTLKRLSLIPDIEEKFEKAFIILQRDYHYLEDYRFFLKTLKEISTDTEEDYFTFMLEANSCEKEDNV